MAAPNSPPSAVSPPEAATPPPPEQLSPPPPEQLSPPPPSPSQLNATSPTSTPPPTPPPTSPPPPIHSTSPSPATPSPPPTQRPPPKTSSPPPPSSSNSPSPPPSSPPPPSTDPPPTSPPPPLSANPPPQNSLPPRPKPPESSPPPPPSKPPEGSNPKPPSNPPPSKPPKGSSPTPSSTPPPPPTLSPPSNPPTKSPPPPIIQPSPPPTSPSPLSPSGTLTTNNTSSSSPESPNSGNGGINTGSVVAICVVLGFVLLTVIGAIAWCLKRRKKNVAALNGGYIMSTSQSSSRKSDSAFLRAHISSPRSGSIHSPTDFSYEELVKATNGFSEQNLLGEGGFGSVYKGNLTDGTEIAVKQLKIGGGQGEREFKAEVEIISRIHHRHLVSLVGYCISENQRLLVYEYVPNNTLYFHLHVKGGPVMDWALRVKVAIGATRGIAYLHQDCHPRVIHRDIKSSNILLDNNFEARVSDFGLAKLALDANTHITTRVMGTFGYLAPEYAFSGQLTDKSDVYSFGVVLLELITGRKSVDTSQPMGDESLVEWARPLLSNALDTGEFEGLVDPRLEKNYVDSELFLMIEAAAACVRHSAKKRPRMRQIVTAFDSMATLDLTNGMKVGESQIHNSAEESEEIRLFRRMAFGSQDYSSDSFSQSSWNS